MKNIISWNICEISAPSSPAVQDDMQRYFTPENVKSQERKKENVYWRWHLLKVWGLLYWHAMLHLSSHQQWHYNYYIKSRLWIFWLDGTITCKTNWKYYNDDFSVFSKELWKGKVFHYTPKSYMYGIDCVFYFHSFSNCLCI